MLPKIIIHNSISIDGSLTSFEPNMGLHYRIAGNYQPEIHLIGSNTIKAGTEMFGGFIPPEEKSDFFKQEREKNLPLWVIIDTKGICRGLLHTCRRFEFCRDVIILACENTPGTYLDHLKERNYDYFIVGKDHVDIKNALSLLAEQYNARTILTDTGRILGNLLLNQGLADEISLLVHPVITGENSYPVFIEMKRMINFELSRCEVLENEYIWLVYKVIK